MFSRRRSGVRPTAAVSDGKTAICSLSGSSVLKIRVITSVVARVHIENEETDAEGKRIDPKVFSPQSGLKIISSRKLAKADGVKALTNIAAAAETGGNLVLERCCSSTAPEP